MRDNLAAWKGITSDVFILNCISGYQLEFVETPVQHVLPREIRFNQTDKDNISAEVNRLLAIGAITKCRHEQGEFISNIFARKKQNGRTRVILNLKALNEFLAYEHFKMEHINFVTDLVNYGDYLGSLDLSDAYFAVPIHIDYWKYLKFKWNDNLYCYKVLVFGMSVAPRIFTRICKPVLARLRGEYGIRCSIYIDDMILINKAQNGLRRDIEIARALLVSLGFTINTEKSVLKPHTSLVHLGFKIDTLDLTLSIPDRKVALIENKCNVVLQNHLRIKIRDVASLIGYLISTLEATKWGKLFYRCLERDKVSALKHAKGNFDAYMSISKSATDNINWWLSSEKLIPSSFAYCPTDLEIYSDASNNGWGAHALNTEIGGQWDTSEKESHINWLELKACWLACQSFLKDRSSVHAIVWLDNACAISYIRNKGGMIPKLDSLAKDFWLWCKRRNITLTASFIPGKENVIADSKSRIFHVNTEWELNDESFAMITDRFGLPNIDLFASRLNHKLRRYVSWDPDPSSCWVDAFTLNWSSYQLCYAFPPFNLIGKVLAKTRDNNAELVIVVPDWKTQYWYPLLLQLTVANTSPLSLKKGKRALHLPFDLEAVHPIYNRLNLLCFRVSGKR